MLIKAIEVGYLQTNCYIVADEATLDAAVIDPGADSNLILDYIERCHFHVRAILLTHGHFDHCMGLEEVYDATGATVYMSHADLTTDIVVLLAGWVLGPMYGGAAAGLGSMLADLVSGA